jgi:hypothetical protein
LQAAHPSVVTRPFGVASVLVFVQLRRCWSRNSRDPPTFAPQLYRVERARLLQNLAGSIDRCQIIIIIDALYAPDGTLCIKHDPVIAHHKRPSLGLLDRSIATRLRVFQIRVVSIIRSGLTFHPLIRIFFATCLGREIVELKRQ